MTWVRAAALAGRAILVLPLATAATAPQAQTGAPAPAPPGKAAPAAAEPTPPREPAPPPYEPQLLRLAEIIGALAYLRELCGEGDGAEWRKRMSSLIEAEGKTEMRKEALAGAFNRGFRGYELTYHSCTASAGVVIGRYLEEGGRIAREITSRYGS
ncbi:MAG: TIGR02301 family protein [Methylobacteriaceae bacterium]|nr:TIGR02301 family protein [Methylobacteriaceae bacterium]